VVQLDYIKEEFFSVRVVKHWNWLPREEVEAQSLETFEVRLEGPLRNLT